MGMILATVANRHAIEGKASYISYIFSFCNETFFLATPWFIPLTKFSTYSERPKKAKWLMLDLLWIHATDEVEWA